MQASGSFGTALHIALENYVKNGYEHKNPYIAKWIDRYKTLGLDDSKIETEIKMFDEENLIAGTADQVEVHEKGIIINDHKTSLKLFDGQPGKEGKNGKPLLGRAFGKKDSPLNGINRDYNMAPKVFEYALQLSMYQDMLVKLGHKVIGRNIIWLDVEKDEISIIPVEYGRGM